MSGKENRFTIRRAALKAKGLCVWCATNPSEGQSLCRDCAGKNLVKQKQRYKEQAEKLRADRRNRYRMENGIPLDAPLLKQGRPQTVGKEPA